VFTAFNPIFIPPTSNRPSKVPLAALRLPEKVPVAALKLPAKLPVAADNAPLKVPPPLMVKFVPSNFNLSFSENFADVST